MNDLTALQQDLREANGNLAAVEMTSTDRAPIYHIYVQMVPLSSRAETEAAAWQRLQATLSCISAHQEAFEAESAIEVMIGLPEFVSKTKRRIFRVGGPLSALERIKAQSPSTSSSANVNVYEYDDWASQPRTP